MKENTIEVEVDTATDGNLWFIPLGTVVRGRLDFLRLAQRLPDAIKLSMEYPKGIPGQRLRVDLNTGRCSIVDPLNEPGWAATRAKIEKQGIGIPPDSDHTVSNVADWLWAIHRALRDNIVRITKGELPADLGIETPHREPQDPADVKIDRLCTLVETLLERLAAPAAR